MSPRRTRRGVIRHETSSPDVGKRLNKTTGSPKEKSRSSSKRRVTRSVKAKATSDSEDNQLRKVSKKASRKKTEKTESDSLITEDESTSESPKAFSRLENSLISEDESTSRIGRAVPSSVARLSTPKSSPITVNLTPHRSTKTPRKSPENLGSPKTHSDTPLRFSKTPRKLEIKDSPTSSEESYTENDENKIATKSRGPHSKPKSQRPKRTSNPRTTRKSTKERTSPEEEDLPSKLNKSVSPVSKKDSPKPRRSVPASKLKKSPIKLLGSASLQIFSKVAVVKLEKFDELTKQSDITPVSTPPQALGAASPRRSKSIGKKLSFVSDLGTPLKSVLTPRNRKSSLKNNNLQADAEINSGIRQKSPRNVNVNHSSSKRNMRRSLNLPENLDETCSFVRKRSSTPKNKCFGFAAIQDESEIVMSDTSLISMGDAFDSDTSQKGEADKNETYEVLEPKTPSLVTRKAKRRSLNDTNLNRNETENKKVRFAVSEVVSDSNVVKLRSGTPGHKTSLKRTSETRSKSKSPPKLSKGLNDTARRRSKSTSVVERTPRTPMDRKRINSVDNSNLKSDSKAQMASVNRLSRPRTSVFSDKKIETKTPVARKIPNFAEIHKKNFDKMESVVDAKKRVEERHVAMINPVVLLNSKSMQEFAAEKRFGSSNLPGSSHITNGMYNRFGFKVRKNEAVESIVKKKSTLTSEKKKSMRREILKGVRTNRRFELQMKSRQSLGSK